VEIGFGFQVVDDWSKLLITTRAAEESDAGFVIEWPVVVEGITTGTTDHAVAAHH